MSNFDFIREFDNTLYVLGSKVEKNVNISPSAVITDASRFLEYLLKKLMEKAGLKYNSYKDFYEQLDSVYRLGKINYDYKQLIYSAYLLRNKIHADFDEFQKNEVQFALSIHEKLYYIAKKYYQDNYENYDQYKGIPSFKPIELDTTDDEIEQVKIPDFNDIVDIKYDYCIICGEPNHSNYSLLCPDCNRKLDDANNFISIRNYFGKNSSFTKEDLLEYGLKEAYANQLISSLTRQDMLKVKGRYISFNNMGLDDYLSSIDKYLTICELVTKFREDKITPNQIKKTTEYRHGSKKIEPYYQFYKVIDKEIINKFERDILKTRDIRNTVEFTTITEKQLERWYKVGMNSYKKGNVNESFKLVNELLIAEYIELKRHGMLDSQIRKQLNVTDEIYDFFSLIDEDFEDEIAEIKIKLLLDAITSGKTREDTIEYAGVTAKEYDNIVKVANFKKSEFAQIRNAEIEKRKNKFVNYLKTNDLKTACGLSKITLDDFYEYYESSSPESDFYKKSTEILMKKYLAQRKISKTKTEAIEKIGIKKKYVERWLTRSQYRHFKDENLKITVDLILRGFKNKKPIDEIARAAEVTVNAIYVYIDMGRRGDKIYVPLFEYYENEVIPEKLEKFITTDKNYKKSLEFADLSEEELEIYYELGKSGDERFKNFYDKFYEIKKGTYALYIEKGKSHKIAMKESRLTEEEYEENRDDMDRIIRTVKFKLVLDEIKNDKTSNIAAKKARCSVDEIYEWYFKGRDGEEEYEDFYKGFHGLYVRPNINSILEKTDYENQNLESLIKVNKNQFTKKDVEIWVKNGLLENKAINLKSDEDDEDKKESKFNANEMLREMGVEDYDKISVKKQSHTSSILNNSDVDIEMLKKQIMKK